MADIPERGQFEEQLTGLLLPLANRHRERLIRLMGKPPDASRVPEDFWETVRREQEAELLAFLLLIFLASMSHRGADPTTPGAQAQAAAYAARQAAEQAAAYAARSRELAISLAADVRASITGAGPALAGDDVLKRYEGIFGEGRVRRISVTETTSAVSAGGEAGASVAGGLSLADIWWTEQDGRVCEICRPLHEQKRSVWQAAFPSGPPAHPMCRCWIEYRSRFRDGPKAAPAGGRGPTTVVLDL